MDLSQLVSGALESVALAAGIPATYRRGNQTVSITVIPARTEYRQEARQAVALQSDRFDFMTDAAGLVIGSAQILPARGDVLTIARNSETTTYDITSDTGEQPYRLDQTETILRFQTRARTRT